MSVRRFEWDSDFERYYTAEGEGTALNPVVLDTDYAAAIRALRDAVEVIKTWHNMDGPAAADWWDIYYRDAPEMASIRQLLQGEA